MTVTIATPNKNTSTQILPVFARHETFHPRFGWLKKGFDLLSSDPQVFTRKDAPVVLGVGKNMVNTIRYWVQAFGVAKESEAGSAKSREYAPTDFGARLLGSTGWDPYLESLGSLWLLHWQLVRPVSVAPTWFFGMNAFPHITFTTDEFLQELNNFRGQHFPTNRVASSSLKKDMSCFLRMYAEVPSKKGVKEESIDSPFTQLGLIQAQRSNRYQFNIGYKPTLPSEVIVFACLDYAQMLNAGQTLKLDSLLFNESSPGFVFKLNESSLSEAILDVSRRIPEIQLTEAAGLLQFSFQGDAGTLALQLLDRFYKENA